ncbi:fibronectin type III domain-containing protein [Virgibacillus halodenitrificans]|uniref:fibronectin type III domain-containing protein n=1 Tax=Virgibacillus halodenitrificans TaxID=1482 RepID=UPI0013CE9255|nr:fibronectin type III domain-containing protein [Virgibacillus halodenitrificans]
MMKTKRKHYLHIFIVFTLAAVGIFFLLSFNSYLQPYIEEEMTKALIPVIIFALLMKLVGFGYTKEIDGKNNFLMLVHILYQIRVVFLFLILFAMMFHSFGKNDSLLNIMGEYYAEKTSQQILTVYNAEDNFVYDHKNRVYYLYNKEIELKDHYTYKVTFLDSSRIIVNVEGPLNQEGFELEDSVQIKAAEYRNGNITLEWEPFYLKGEESNKYRIKSYRRLKDGTLMRSGSQIVLEDKETTATIEKVLENEEYQFVIEPYFNKEFNNEYKGTSVSIETD